MKFTRANFQKLIDENAGLRGKIAWLKSEQEQGYDSRPTLLDGATPELVEAVAKALHALPWGVSETCMARAALGAIVAHESEALKVLAESANQETRRAEKAEAECVRLQEHNQTVLTGQVRQAEERAEKAEARVADLESSLNTKVMDRTTRLELEHAGIVVKKNNRISELEDECVRLNDESRDYSVQVAQLKARVAELDGAEARAEALDAKAIELRARVAELEKERDEWKHCYEAMNARHDTALARIAELEQDLSDRERKSADYAREAEHFGLRCRELEKERDEAVYHAERMTESCDALSSKLRDLTKPRDVDEALVEEMAKVACGAWSENDWNQTTKYYRDCFRKEARAILAALPQPAPQVLDDAECDRLYNVYRYRVDTGTSACWPGDRREAIRALLAAAGRYVQPESKGPATDNHLESTYAGAHLPNGVSVHAARLRAVYDLGVRDGQQWQGGSVPLKDHANALKEAFSRFVPFVPDDALVEKMAKALSKAQGTDEADDEAWRCHWNEARAALSAMPPLFVAAAEDHDLDPPQPVHLNEEKLIAAYPLGKPERLPFRGLTKEEAATLQVHLDLLNAGHHTSEALRILARAMGCE